MNELIGKVEQWAIDRNLHTADSKGQVLKVVEEFTETLIEIDKNSKEPKIHDGIGDTYVTLIILCQQIKADFKDLRKQSKELSKGKTFSLLDQHQYALNNLATGTAKGNTELTQYGVLGILYALDLMINKYGVTDEECLSVAYNEIKDRTGKMIDGVFVKTEDL